MIACHCSTSTPDAQATFERTLRSALRVFKPGAIFVCDNGNGKKPADDTEEVVRRIHPEIHYLFIPEGNKTHAMYWCTEYWIPELHRQGRRRRQHLLCLRKHRPLCHRTGRPRSSTSSPLQSKPRGTSPTTR